MSLIYITGNSGAGKSSVRNELQRRGYEAYDTDDGLTAWHHKTTNKVVERPTNEKDRTKEWYEAHDWKMSIEKVKELATKAKNKPIFLCGSPSNADEMLDLYDIVICLTVDKDTLQKRINSRTDNDFGKAPDELKNILGWHEAFQNRYRGYEAIMIDANRPLHEVVDDILKNIAY